MRGFVIGIAILGLFSAQAAVNVRLRYLEPAWVEPSAEQKQKWDPNLYRTLSFGQLATAIDALWLRVVIDPTIAHVAEGERARIFYDLDLATDLDRDYFELYHSGSYLLSIIRNDNEGARDILLKGLHRFRNEIQAYPEWFRKRFWDRAYSLYLTLGYVYLYELNDMPRASEIFREAASVPGSPEYLKTLKQRLESPDGQYEVALRLLAFLLTEQKDERAREKLVQKQRSLVVSRFVYTLNRQFEEWLAKRPRSALSQDRRLSWKAYAAQARIPRTDPWGGLLDVNPEGRIDTTTPRQKVFGLR